MRAWQQSGSKESSDRIYELFADMEDMYRSGLDSVKPTVDVVTKVLEAVSETRRNGGEKRAWSIIKRLDRYGLEPTGRMYALLIRATARSRENGAARLAEDNLRKALELFPPSKDGINIDTFNVVLTSWAKSNLSYGPERAEKLLVFMDEVDKKHGGTGFLKPNVHSFTSLIDAYAQTTEWDGVSHSERILNNMLSTFLESNDPMLEPNVASWTIVISAWTRLSKKNQRGAAPRADTLLKRMEELYAAGRISFAPDAITYVTVMNAWALSRRDDGPEKAEEILDEMNEQYIDGDDSFKPSSKSIRNIVEAWVKLETLNGLQRAEKFLQRYMSIDSMQETTDETKDVFKTLLFGWSKQENPYRAQDYLFEMAKRGLKPDSFSFDRVIESYTQLDAEDSAVKSKQVFDLMEKCRRAGDIQPNERVYTSFLRSLTKAKVPKLPQKAVALLNRMKELYAEGNKGIKPTVFSYNAALNACAESRSDDDDAANMDAFKTALSIFNELRAARGEAPDHVTYGNMLRCSKLLPEGEQRDSIITSTFKLCANDGFVNSFVLRDLLYAANEELWRGLTGKDSGEPAVERLPTAWSRRFNRKPEKKKDEDNNENRGPRRFSRGRQRR